MAALAVADEHAPLGRLEVLQAQRRHLTATQAAKHHRLDHGAVPQGAQHGEQGVASAGGQNGQLDRRNQQHSGDAMIGGDAVVTAASPLGQMLGDLGVAGLLAVFPLIVLSNVFSSPLLFVDDPDWDFRTAADDDPADLVALYEHACERSRQAVASVASLDDLTSEVPRRGGVQRFNLRWVLLHMIEETARHAGHADLLREAIDGATGE